MMSNKALRKAKETHNSVYILDDGDVYSYPNVVEAVYIGQVHLLDFPLFLRTDGTYCWRNYSKVFPIKEEAEKEAKSIYNYRVGQIKENIDELKNNLDKLKEDEERRSIRSHKG